MAQCPPSLGTVARGNHTASRPANRRTFLSELVTAPPLLAGGDAVGAQEGLKRTSYRPVTSRCRVRARFREPQGREHGARDGDDSRCSDRSMAICLITFVSASQHRSNGCARRLWGPEIACACLAPEAMRDDTNQVSECVLVGMYQTVPGLHHLVHGARHGRHVNQPMPCLERRRSKGDGV